MYRAEMTFLSPSFRIVLDLLGHHKIFLVIAFLANLGEFLFFVENIDRRGVDFFNGPGVIQIILFMIINLATCHKEIYKKKPSHMNDRENMPISPYAHFQFYGLCVLVTNQEMKASDAGVKLNKNQKLSNLANSLLLNTIVECSTFYFLPMFLPCAFSALITLRRSVNRGETIIAILAGATVWSKMVQCLILTHTAFYVRLSQKVCDLEIRRVEADFKTIKSTNIHRVAPRYKALLRECHNIENTSHKFFVLFFTIFVLTCFQFVGAIFAPTLAEGEVVCVPFWCFFSTFQPVFSIIFCVHGYAKLNLAIERDADQDIVELNVRLSYSETHVPNWLLQQLHALDRLDGRAFALPFDVIPEMKMSRSVITSLGTIIVVLAPYLVSVYGSTDAELLCR